MHPDSNEFCISSLKIKGEFDLVTGKVEALGDISAVTSERDGSGLRIVTDKTPETDKPLCFKIEII